MSDDTPAMTSNRPYLIRAMYEWIGDNDMTPYLLVDAAHPQLQCPPQAVQDGRIVLNIAARAVAQLDLGNEMIRFKARFSGVSQEVFVPLGAVQAIYAQETGQGMMLPEEDPSQHPGQVPAGESRSQHDEDGGDDDGSGPGRRGGHLRVVK
jgi:stringent starvation protein B